MTLLSELCAYETTDHTSGQGMAVWSMHETE